MTSAAWGVAYPLWLRSRWILIPVLLLIFAMAIATQAFPDASEITGSAGLLLPLAIIALLNIVTYGPADLGGRSSAFPTHMLILPLRTRALVAWPMLYGVGSIVMLWVLLAVLVFIPSGAQTPILWPAVVLASAIAWIQALSWSPFPSPFVRIPALVLAICPTIGLLMWRALHPNSDGVAIGVIAGGLVWTLAAFGFAVLGLSRARAGNESNWFAQIAAYFRTTNADTAEFTSLRPLSFRSPAAAQLWYDLRRGCMYPPALLLMVAVPILVLLCTTVTDRTGNEGLMVGEFKVSTITLDLGIMLFGPLLLTTMSGPGIASFDYWNKHPFPTFFATRPVATAQLAGNKFKAAAISAISIWLIVVLSIGIWAAVEMSPLNPRTSVLKHLWDQASAKDRVGALLLAAALLVVFCRNLMVGMWPTLSGRRWLATLLGVASAVAVFSAPGLLGWTYRSPEVRRWLLAQLPWEVGAAVALKLCAAAVVGAALVRRKILPVRTVTACIGCWLALAAAVIAIGSAYFAWTWYLPAGAILMLPLVRVGLAPLALDWNRHR